MKKLLVLLSALLLVATAPAAEVSLDVHFALSADGEETTTFNTDAPKIFAVFESEGTKKDAALRSVWIAEDVGTAAPANTKIDEATIKAGQDDASGTFSLSRPNKGWPPGKYRVEFYVDKALVKTLRFTIAAKKSE
ncbi:MAG: hypothetical protein JSR82_05115 [Verrucomicrobia bacterium]|nr:hypothetical protein [Verrucomicrobiota bacterium]